MKKKTFFSNRYSGYVLVLLLGLFTGWLLFHTKRVNEPSVIPAVEEVSHDTIWTCSMHPSVRMSQPGLCPICGMDLIPLIHEESPAADNDAIHMTSGAVRLANVMTTVISRQSPVKETRLYGKVEVDERLLQSQVAHISGRIESLEVSFTGEPVTSGQVLGEIWSPELITAQQELIEAARTKLEQPDIYEAARAKLLSWKLTETQVSGIEESGEVKNTVPILSGTTGVVTSRKVNKGDYVSPGTVLFEIADLSRVWVMFDAYENDLQFLKKGEPLSFTIQALPGEKFGGKIIFIDPVIDSYTRVAGVRVEAANRTGRLKPGMFASGLVTSPVGSGRGNIVIPRSSVLWTGKRSVVYLKLSSSDEPVFKMREIELGPAVGDSYIVRQGLTEGDEIVTRGTFSIDAAAQLEGKPSMMNSETGENPEHSEISPMPDMHRE
jgi:Cu(I)/Ag(I) efflux system membrane fusion protein